MNTKLIVPVVAVLICAGAMVGIGYAALSSDYTTNGNSITGNVFEVAPGDSSDFRFSAAIPYETHTAVSGNTTTKTYSVNNGNGGATIDLTGVENIVITDSTSLGYTSYNITVELTGLNTVQDKDSKTPTYSVDFHAPTGHTVTKIDSHSANVQRASTGNTTNTTNTTATFDITLDFTGLTFDDATKLNNNNLTLKVTVTGVTGTVSSQ